jgi:hypothetical protein
MRFFCLAIALALVAITASDSWGQSKRNPPPREEAKSAQQSAQTDQRGTEQAPAVVKIIPTPKTPEETEADRREKEQKDTNDTRLVWFTGLLAGIGFLQLLVFGWQGIQLQRTVRASENEFNATHRPKIRIKHCVLASDIAQDVPILINLTCVNTGTSDALLQQVGMRFFVERTGRALPMEPEIPIIFGAGGARLESGLNYPFPNLPVGMLNAAQYSAIETGAAQLYCVGYVSYHDAAKRMRITGFCRVLVFPENSIAHSGNRRFRKFDDSDYEYED